MDMTIAACAVQSVVEPQSTSIGGDCFAFIQKLEVTTYGYEWLTGRAPIGLSAEWLLNHGSKG